MEFPHFTIEALAEKIPESLLARSGKVFYSGRQAFSKPSPLYVLGVNPGGDPAHYESETSGITQPLCCTRIRIAGLHTVTSRGRGLSLEPMEWPRESCICSHRLG